MSEIRSGGAADTERAGADLAEALSAGDLVLISGELGAGKTTLVRGACRALGITGPIVSPTFTIGRRYVAEDGAVISHLDLYRLGSLEGEDPGLVDDYLTPDAIAFVEWPGVAAGDLTEPRATVEIRHAGGDNRLISIRLRSGQ